MSYQIKVNGLVFKKYPTRLQCVIWCFLNKYVVRGFSDFIGDRQDGVYLSSRISISEVEE